MLSKYVFGEKKLKKISGKTYDDRNGLCCTVNSENNEYYLRPNF